jgi:hypothetical protein
MVNFTVSISEELKTEMDKYPEVNWSEVIRKSIQTYLQTRQNPVPQLEFGISEAHVAWNWFLARPSVSVNLKATNKLTTDLVLDRILYTIGFLTSQNREARGGFEGQFLQYCQLKPNEPADIQLTFYPNTELLRRLTDKMESTFVLQADLIVLVQGFTNPYRAQVFSKVPIDEWKNEAKSALDEYERHWNPRKPQVKDQVEVG